MNPLWSPAVRDLAPYVPGEQPKHPRLVKLNTNELPYPPSPRVRQAIVAAMESDGASLRLYPDPQAMALREVIAAREQLSPAQVFAGNGSDEVLAFVFQALLVREQPLRFPDISYSFYPSWCRLYGIKHRAMALRDDFSLAVDDYLDGDPAARGPVIIPNPNAPTGMALPIAEIERLVAGCPAHVVVIDEAYVDFGAETAAGLIARYPNLLVVRTMSKSHGLAGLRVGYALGDEGLIEALVRVKDSFNSYPLDRLALAGAQAALEDEAWFRQQRDAVVDAREALIAALRERGFEVLPSKANFILARHPAHDGAQLAAALREQGIIVRHFPKARIDQWLRITVGTPQQCDALVQAFEALNRKTERR